MKLKDTVLLLIFGEILAFVFAVTLNIFAFQIVTVNSFADIIVAIKDGTTLALFGIFSLLILIFAITKISDKTFKSGSTGSGSTKDGKKMEQYYSSRFVSDKELKSDKKFMYSLYRDLKTRNFDGIPLRAQLVKNELQVNMYKPIHTIVIGTTGSGKTTMLVTPTIQILSETKNKPSMVISDPKGELYLQNVVKLKESGYEVQVIDLREPDKSSRWNPLQKPFEYYHYAHNLAKTVIIHRDENPNNYPNLQKIKDNIYANEWYEFNGVAYPNNTLLTQDLKAIKDKYINLANEDVTNIAVTLCPISGQDPSWSRGAQGFLKAIMLAMLEDSLIPELGMTKEKFNFFNVTQIATRRDNDPNDALKTLKNYFVGRDILSESVNLSNTVMANAAVTAKGFLGHVTGSLSLFSDSGVCYLTSGTDIDLDHFADKPSALFIKIPDEKDNRHALANMYITQLYNILIERANERGKTTGDISLPRDVYFLLDEFGNLPKIEKLKSFITAGRSRKIFLMLVIQDYTQLSSIYGENDAATIKNNCNIHIFIGTKDMKTREEFAKNCGNVAITMENKTESSGKTPDSKSSSTSKSVVNRPLIYPEELEHLEKNQVIINAFKEFSMKTIFTPTYQNPIYKLTPPIEGYVQSKFLDKKAVFYDIEERNKKILVEDDDDDDDDFDFMNPFKKKK